MFFMQPSLCLLDAPYFQVTETSIKLKPSKPIYLLIYLAYHHDWLSRDVLSNLLWTEMPCG
jgi:hypothetical protein